MHPPDPQAGDEHAVVGGPGVSFWVSKNPGVQPWDDIVSASNLVLLAVNESLPLDFISFHVVTSCSDPSTCTSADVRPGLPASCLPRCKLRRRTSTPPSQLLWPALGA